MFLSYELNSEFLNELYFLNYIFFKDKSKCQYVIGSIKDEIIWYI